MKFFGVVALAAVATAQYAPAPAPAAYAPAPAPAAYAPAVQPVPLALMAQQSQSSGTALKAMFAKFCFAPKHGGPLAEVLGTLEDAIRQLQEQVLALAGAAQEVELLKTCIAFAGTPDELSDCAANGVAICTPTADPADSTCPAGTECVPLTGGAGAGAPGFCAAPQSIAAN